MRLHRIDDELSIDFNDTRGTIGLYDTRAYTPKLQTVLTECQMWDVLKVWLDGCCPVCGIQIPAKDLLCGDCLRMALDQAAGEVTGL